MLDWKPGARRDCMGRRRRAWFSECGRYKVSESKLRGEPRRFYALVRNAWGAWSAIEGSRTYRKETAAKRVCEKHARLCDSAAAQNVTRRLATV